MNVRSRLMIASNLSSTADLSSHFIAFSPCSLGHHI